MERALRARAAIADVGVWARRGPNTRRDLIVDMIADLLHLAQAEGLALADVIEASFGHYNNEKQP